MKRSPSLHPQGKVDKFSLSGFFQRSKSGGSHGLLTRPHEGHVVQLARWAGGEGRRKWRQRSREHEEGGGGRVVQEVKGPRAGEGRGGGKGASGATVVERATTTTTRGGSETEGREGDGGSGNRGPTTASLFSLCEFLNRRNGPIAFDHSNND